jgi:hypothetical protein
MRFTLLAVALPLALGCSAAGNVQFTSSTEGATGGGGAGSTGSAGSTGGAGSTGSAAAGTGGGTGGGIHFGTGGGGGGVEIAEVFAQSDSVLYKLDPVTKLVTTVGPFNGCNGSVIDIAIDKDGAMFGTTFGGLYKIDKASAACTHISDGSYPNSLSFVPKGTLDQNVEALVGYEGSSYVRIDTTTGVLTQIGDLGSGYASSGDVVSVIGGGTYLTVNGNACSDCIVEVDPKTGALKNMIGPLGHSAVFGLAFWGGAAYGFDDGGELFQIDLANGHSTTIPITPGLSFYGAGSTTSAPLLPPN